MSAVSPVAAQVGTVVRIYRMNVSGSETGRAGNAAGIPGEKTPAPRVLRSSYATRTPFPARSSWDRQDGCQSSAFR